MLDFNFIQDGIFFTTQTDNENSEYQDSEWMNPCRLNINRAGCYLNDECYKASDRRLGSSTKEILLDPALCKEWN